MRYYTKITIWENQSRLHKLSEFRKLILNYFIHSRAESLVGERIEEKEARKARVLINRAMDEVHDIILYSGINPSIRWTPPAAVGGYIQNIDLIQNIFRIDKFMIAPNDLLDFIDRSIGIYENNHGRALARTLNPFFYVGMLFDWISELPFMLIARLGFNRERAESSIIGRTTKGALYLITVLAAFLTILHLLGYLEPVKQLVRQIFGSN